MFADQLIEAGATATDAPELRVMMSAAQCRAKADSLDLLAKAALRTDYALELTDLARVWRSLAVQAEYQEHMRSEGHPAG